MAQFDQGKRIVGRLYIDNANKTKMYASLTLSHALRLQAYLHHEPVGKDEKVIEEIIAHSKAIEKLVHSLAFMNKADEKPQPPLTPTF